LQSGNHQVSPAFLRDLSHAVSKQFRKHHTLFHQHYTLWTPATPRTLARFYSGSEMKPVQMKQVDFDE